MHSLTIRGVQRRVLLASRGEDVYRERPTESHQWAESQDFYMSEMKMKVSLVLNIKNDQDFSQMFLF